MPPTKSSNKLTRPYSLAFLLQRFLHLLKGFEHLRLLGGQRRVGLREVAARAAEGRKQLADAGACGDKRKKKKEEGEVLGKEHQYKHITAYLRKKEEQYATVEALLTSSKLDTASHEITIKKPFLICWLNI